MSESSAKSRRETAKALRRALLAAAGLPGGNGSGGGTAPTLTAKTVTANGTYAAADDGADGYSAVTVDVHGGEAEVLYGVLSRMIQTIHTDAPLIGLQALAYCINLESAVLPKATEIKINSFLGCSSMQSVDIGATSIGNGAFQSSIQFNTLVLRSGTVCSVSNINAFNNTPFASGKAGGTLYVPSALIASYQAATNWSTILGYPNNQIKAIEGSIYETQYVDGTPIA